ncbi:hypothetical protein LBMAG42_27820 [Deltaproteobacteria bacterium]|nr:hypothetical protein LBMAG42_27820 [Deltaproteobacteria bacterium]
MLSLWLGLACAPDPGGIVVLSFDTLRADRLGAYGSTAKLTPNLDRFAAESVIFDQAFAQANETLFSHAALFTSQYPSRLAALNGDFRLPQGTATLASTFEGAGWETAAFVAGGHLSAGFGLDAGFEVYDDSSAWGSLRETGALALRWLDTRPAKAPFFLFVHSYDTHDRYLRPSPFGYAFADPASQTVGARIGREVGGTTHIGGGAYVQDLTRLELLSLSAPRFEGGRGLRAAEPTAEPLADDDRAHLTALYDGSVAWADACFGRFMAGLDERDLLDTTTIVVLSDHGELLGEGGQFGHRGSLDDAVTRVPLLVRPPGGVGARRLTGLVGLIDVAPTLLEIAGVEARLYGDGISLAPTLAGEAQALRGTIVSEGGLRLLSARGATGRLTAEGASIENPWFAPLLRVAPVDGITLKVAGDGDAEPLRAGLLAHLEGK